MQNPTKTAARPLAAAGRAAALMSGLGRFGLLVGLAGGLSAGLAEGFTGGLTGGPAHAQGIGLRPTQSSSQAGSQFGPGARAFAPLDAPGLSLFGLPGHVTMPSGHALPDGTFALSVNQMGGGIRRANLVFQISPRVTGLFRYAWVQNYYGAHLSPSSLYDRSFDLRLLLLEEDLAGWRPAVSLGLQDFGGSGYFGAEYLVASRRLTPRLTASLGIGWGRLGSYNSFRNPLSLISDRFDTRPSDLARMDQTGRIAFERMFRGPAAGFAGLDWQATDRLRLSVEYSSDAMEREVQRQGFVHRSPFNLGLDWQLGAGGLWGSGLPGGGRIGAAVIGGSELALSYALVLDPRRVRAPSGFEPGPPPLGRGGAVARGADLSARIAGHFAQQGLRLDGIEIGSGEARVALANLRYPAEAQGWGRALRVLARELPPEVELLRLRAQSGEGLAIREIAFRREGLEEIEHAADGAAIAYARAGNRDAAIRPDLDWRPHGGVSLLPYIQPAFFDPDDPLRFDIGAELRASWAPVQGLVVSGAIRQRLVGTLDEASRPSNSVLPHVRSHGAGYYADTGPYIPWATAEWFARPGRDLYSRLTLGWLERMYGGVSGELLWAPVGRRYAFGAELNYALQRAPRGLGFNEYRIATGHLSGYYAFGGDYHGRLDLGRYLAGDLGGTATLSRRFGNGLEVGAFFSLTDVSFAQFGEGAFDKGIFITLPLVNLLGRPSRDSATLTLRPIERDGGARLSLRNRLEGLTRPIREAAAGEGWERFWR